MPGFGSNTTASSEFSGYAPGSRQFPFDVPEAFKVPYAGQDSGPVRGLTDDITQIDVRTKNMRALEEAALPLLFSTLLNPSSIGALFGNMAGAVPGMTEAPAVNASVMDAAPQQQAAAGLLSQLFSGGGLGGGMGGLPPTPGYGGGEIPNPPPLNLPPVNGQQPSAPGLPPASQPTPISNIPTTFPGAGMPDLPNQYGGIGNIIPGSVGAPGGDAAYQQAVAGIQSGTQYPTVDPDVIRLAFMQHGRNMRPEDLSYWQPKIQSGYGIDKMYSDLASFFASPGAANFPVDFRATGGPLDPNKFTLVGEAGPELITPAAGGQQQVVPNMQTMQASSANQLQPLPQLPQLGGFQTSALQGAGTGATARLLDQNPEMQTFDIAKGILGGQQNPGQGVVNALQPVFNQNLQSSLGQLRNFAPSVFNSQTGLEGGNVAQRAMNDFNLLAAQALQQGVGQQQQGLGILGQLAGQAGNGAFNRALGAGSLGLQESQAMTGANQAAAAGNAQNLLNRQQIGNQYNLGLGGLANDQLLGLRGQDIQRQLGLTQLGQQQQQFQSNFGLAAQQQQYNQTVNPTLQLLLAALGMAQPTAYQSVVRQ